MRRASGGFVVAKLDGLFFLDAGGTQLTPFADPKAGRMDTCYNDGKADRQGRLWIGTVHVPETDPEGSFYRVDPDGTHAVIETGFVVPNGPAFSPDGRTLYFANTHAGEIIAFDVDPATGEAAHRRLFASVAVEDGWPDGMAVDTEGFVWSAHWGGWRITRYDPEGKIERVVRFPVPPGVELLLRRRGYAHALRHLRHRDHVGGGRCQVPALGLAVRRRDAVRGLPRARLRRLVKSNSARGGQDERRA